VGGSPRTRLIGTTRRETPSPEIRPAGPEDVELVRWALYAALDWSPERELPPFELVLQHPEAARYHVGWGRAGDLGVIAEDDGEAIGVAYSRLFTDDDHGHGYVDSETPEIAIAVREGRRGEGVGGRLLRALAELAREQGFERLSLSVEAENPARRLYERAGYRELGPDPGGGVLMLLDLRESPRTP
jgi:GNAT superfamily N-acetyltransferase